MIEIDDDESGPTVDGGQRMRIVGVGWLFLPRHVRRRRQSGRSARRSLEGDGRTPTVVGQGWGGSPGHVGTMGRWCMCD